MRKPIGKIKNPSLARRVRRKLRIRSTLSGTTECPRVSFAKTNKNLSVQVVDDSKCVTLFSVQTFGKKATVSANNKESAKTLGTAVGNELKKRNLTTAVFDRSGYKYHGVVASLADGIREAGIKL